MEPSSRRAFGIAVLVAAVVCAVIAWVAWPRGDDAAARPGPAPGEGGAGASGSPPTYGTGTGPGIVVGADAASPHAPTRLIRLDLDARRQLRARIAAKRQQTQAGIGSDGVPLEDVVIPLERAGKAAQEALQESVKVLAECYESRPGGAGAATATAMMVMTSDPEFGTVIDTQEITDADGKPLERALDECLRDRIDSLALPPLGEGGKLPIKYTFSFDGE